MRPTKLSESFVELSLTSENERLLGELEETNKKLREIVLRLEKNPPLWRSIFSIVGKCFRLYYKSFLALPNLTATLLWLAMLLYFTAWYLRLPLDEYGRHPQICKNFSLWPFISCIGEKRPQVFRGVCITMAILISASFLLLCHLSSPVPSAIWLRRASAFFAVLSSSALIVLSFKAIDSAPTAHLVSTSIQIFAMGNTKFFDWISNSVTRRSFQKRIGKAHRIRPLEVSRWLKTAVAAFAAVPAMVTCMGIYSCTNTDIINDSKSTCNKMIALSAVAEWILSIGWVAYMSTISYDLYHIGTVIQIWKLTEDLPEAKVCDLGDQAAQQSLQLLLPDCPCCASKHEGCESFE